MYVFACLQARLKSSLKRCRALVYLIFPPGERIQGRPCHSFGGGWDGAAGPHYHAVNSGGLGFPLPTILFPLPPARALPGFDLICSFGTELSDRTGAVPSSSHTFLSWVGKGALPHQSLWPFTPFSASISGRAMGLAAEGAYLPSRCQQS